MRITCVNYTNAIPFIEGIQAANMKDEKVKLSLDIPSVSGTKLLQGKADIGLVPVAVLPQLKEYRIISDYCIAGFKKVKSVCLFSKVPLSEIKVVLLDYQSMTSVKLVQLLNTFYWKKDIRFLPAAEDFISDIAGSTAAVVIGDRTFGMHDNYPFVYDLCEEWYNYTGLSFMFAAWVCVNPAIDEKEIAWLNEALSQGIQGIEKNKERLMPPIAPYDYYSYLTKNILYQSGPMEKHAMELFHALMKKR
ncbi:MAG: menaquinone biosynthetic enzyme MqnA/MqnD family protein [Bacteroidota bacterium]|jgi:chorismate dehydratase